MSGALSRHLTIDVGEDGWREITVHVKRANGKWDTRHIRVSPEEWASFGKPEGKSKCTERCPTCDEWCYHTGDDPLAHGDGHHVWRTEPNRGGCLNGPSRRP